MSFKAYVGVDRWGIHQWEGSVFRYKLKESEYLTQYAQNLNSVELNATLYKLYDEQTMRTWKSKVAGTPFIFCPKMYNGITSAGSLNNKKELLDTFLKSVTNLDEALGPVYIQLPDTFKMVRMAELNIFLSSLPKQFEYFVEVQHPSWYKGRELNKELRNFLTHNGIGIVLRDRPEPIILVASMKIGNKVYVHYHASIDAASNELRLIDFVNQIKKWRADGLTDLYFFFHFEATVLSPRFIDFFIENLNNSCNLNIERLHSLHQ